MREVSNDVRPLHHVALGAVLVLAVVTAAAPRAVSVPDPTPPLFPDDPVAVAGAVEDAAPSSSAPATTTVPVIDRLPTVAADIPGALRIDGVALPVQGTNGESWFVIGACGDERGVPAAGAVQIPPQHVVLDPGEGGASRGVVTAGLDEADLNLDIAQRVAAGLAELGVAVILTRDRDVDVATVTRGATAPAVGAAAFVSLHHSAPTGSGGEGRPEVFHQIDDPESRRLGALVHEWLTRSRAELGGEWARGGDPGVKPLLNQRGDDFHVVLQASAGVPGVTVELAALGGRETALLATEEGRQAEAVALVEAITRFLVTEESGSGFVEPDERVRDAPTTNAPGACAGG